jgi:acyl carrier protein phosphodiesterase
MIIGNFIADSIKGKSYKQYPDEIQRGILFHRQIDFFTDSHSIVKHSKSFLVPNYGHYAGVLIDIFYDHFLTRNWSLYTKEPLDQFSTRVMKVLQSNEASLPEYPRMFIEYNKKYDSINTYNRLDTIQRVLIGMTRRIEFKIDLAPAVKDLQEHYEALERDFHKFFTDILLNAPDLINKALASMDTDTD